MATRDVIVLDSETKKPVSLLTMKPSQARYSHGGTESFNGSHAKRFNANIINVEKIPLMISSSAGPDRVQLLQPTVLQPTVFGKPMNDGASVKTMIRNDSRSPHPHHHPHSHSHSHSHSHGSKEDHHLVKSHQAVSDIAVKPSKELVQRHLSARKILRRQLDRKLTNVPYPKTYRQVWPVIPVGDSVFLSTVGLEAACSALDSSFKSREPKRRPSNAPKPVCQQCGSDFAPAWQVRKKTESTYLLCEMCDFANLKNVHREKIAAQLKECSTMIDKEFTEIDRKFQSDLQGQVAHSVTSLFQNHNSSSPLSLHSSSSVHKHAQQQQQHQHQHQQPPTAIAQSVIQSSSTTPPTTASIGVPSAAQIQLLMDGTQKPGSTAAAAAGREAESVTRLSALERNLQQRSGGSAVLDAKRKRDLNKKGKLLSSSSKPLNDLPLQSLGTAGRAGHSHTLKPTGTAMTSRGKKLRGSSGTRTLDSMLYMMKSKASLSPQAVSVGSELPPQKEVIEISDGHASGSSSAPAKMATSPVEMFLESKQALEDVSLAQEWAELSRLYQRKLWHQLTVKLMSFMRSEAFKTGGLLELYHNFLVDFELKLNPLSLAEILLHIAVEIDSFYEMVAFIERVKEKVKHSEEATILCVVAIGDVRLRQKDYPAVKLQLDQALGVLELQNGVSKAHAPYYNLSIQYHKSQDNHASYYRDALRYLGCVDIGDIPFSEQVERAYHLALAGVLAEDIYNFGELLAHPVLDSLKDSDKNWIVQLLQAFNAGDLNNMKALESTWKLQPDLRDNEPQLNQKIRLLALMNLTFTHPANERTLPFTTIATVADLPSSKVELLVMKALSLGLVRGTIDEVAQEVHMTWVQPRVLDIEQVGLLHQKMGVWSRSVSATVGHVQRQAKDLLTSQTSF